jgi:ferritin-like metal-binding protein YciE
MSESARQKRLLAYLADAHSIEEQALTQMRAAPGIAGDEPLAGAFEQHLIETERHERLVRGRLEAHGEDPSAIKDLAGKAGGWGMLLFARSQPDSPGKLTAHAFSYEHMELAAYELLGRAALLAEDEATAAVAREIAAEERRMGDRLGGLFEVAVDASLGEVASDDLGAHLDRYLRDAHAIEQQAIRLLQLGPKLVDDEELAALFRDHLGETRGHSRRVSERLEARGAGSSKLKDLALGIGGLNVGAFFAAQPDTTAKLSGFAFAFEHLEIAGYELLKGVASRAADQETVAVAESIVPEERAAAARVAATWDRAMRLEMGEVQA